MSGGSGLAEEFLCEVNEIVKEFADGAVPEEDLLQEGYVGLMEGIAEVEAGRIRMEEDPLGYEETRSVDEIIRTSIRGALKRAVAAHRGQALSDTQLVAAVDKLSRNIDRLAEELGTKPNIDEIANRMGISQEKVLSLMKLTGEVESDASLTGDF